MGLGVIFSSMGTFTHCAHFYPVILSPCFFFYFHILCKFQFPFFVVIFGVFTSGRSSVLAWGVCLSISNVSLKQRATASSHGVTDSSVILPWCFLPQTLHEWPGFQALFNSLTLPSAVGTHSSGLCPHSHASLCCALWFPSQPACYCVGLLTLLLTSSLSAAVGEIKDPSPFRALQRWDNHPTEVTCENSGSTPCGLRVPFSTLPWLLKAH